LKYIVRLFGWVHAGLLLTMVVPAAQLASRSRHEGLPWSRVRLVLRYGQAANELIWWIFRDSHEGIHLTNLTNLTNLTPFNFAM
jgi:hypothetical protein